MARVTEETNESKEQKNTTSPISIVTLDRKSSRSCNRSVTDKYWCFLFIFISVIWTTSWYYALCHHSRQGSKSNSKTTKNETQLNRYYFWGENWFFDVITCNLAFISTHYESSGSIVVGATILLSIGLIKYSVSSMRNNYMFHSQLDKAFFYFLLLTLCFRFLAFYANYLKTESIINVLIQPNHDKLPVWWMPEVICITIWYTKKCYKCDDPLFVRYYDEMRPFSNMMIPFVAVLSAMFCFLYVHTMNIAYDLGWNCALSYIIVAGSCYIALTIFYFLSIVISCAVYYAVDEVPRYDVEHSEKHCLNYSELFYAFVIVGRYHFGTACYHATLIGPRLHALFVMNEPEFKEMPKIAKFTDRFYATHYKLHSLTLIATAVGGINHSESLRGLLRHFSTDLPPKLQYFQAFSQITRSLLAFLMSTNCLTLVTHWFYGLDDSCLFLATWAFYLRIMVVFTVPMKFCDMSSDTISLIRRAPFNYYDLFDVVIQCNYSPRQCMELRRQQT